MNTSVPKLWPVILLLLALCVPPTAPADEACPHDAPPGVCFICDPSLREKGRMWCKEHARYEDRCWECHPELEDKERAYCQEHDLYEDECFICKPELKTSAAPVQSGEKCAAHNAPVASCFICDPTLREKGRIWCNEHTRYEDRCWECHADLQDKNRAYCDEHGLYEDECFLCNPKLKATPSASKSSAPAQKLMCKEHHVAEEECGICHPDLAADLPSGQGLKVRFASAEAAAKAGIATMQPEIMPMFNGIDCYAELQFNQNRLAQIAAPVGGIIQTIETDLGENIKQGQVLAKVWSADIGEAVARAVLTHQTVSRERKLRAERISSEKDLQESEAAYWTARQQLKILGFDDNQIQSLAENSVETAMLELRAPFAGEVVERMAVLGALVEPGKPLFTVADRSTMWGMLNIPETFLALVHVGQDVEFRIDALPEQIFTGKLTWIAANVDGRTRMVQARAEIADPPTTLRANMFAQARILTQGSDKALTVPSSAIQCISARDFVFVKIADDLYEALPVRLGSKGGGRVAISEGLAADQQVVVEGGFVAKSQLLLSRLGAGCVDD